MDVCFVWCDDKRKALPYDAHYDFSWRWLSIMPFKKTISLHGPLFPFFPILSFGIQEQTSSLHLQTVRLFTEGDNTRGCGDTICFPEDEQRAARNTLRIVV